MKGSTCATIAGLAALMLGSVAHATLLKNETFTSAPDTITGGWGGWSVYVTSTATMGGVNNVGGNSGRSLKMTDAATGAIAGDSWKPQLELSSTITTGFTIGFDWYISSPSTLTDAQTLQLYISKKTAPSGVLASIQIGGQSGVKVGTNQSLAFTPVYDQWNKIFIEFDAPGTGSAGKMKISVTQGADDPVSGTFAYSSNVPLSVTSLSFQLGGSAAAGDNVAAYLDNIVIETVPEAASLGLLGLGACALLRRRI